MSSSRQELITNEQLLKAICNVVPREYIISLRQETVTEATLYANEVSYLTIYLNDKHAYAGIHEITRGLHSKERKIPDGYNRNNECYAICLIHPGNVLRHFDNGEIRICHNKRKFEEVYVKSSARDLRAKFESQRFHFSKEILKYLKVYEEYLLKASTYKELEKLQKVSIDLNLAIKNAFKDSYTLEMLVRHLYGAPLISKAQVQRIHDHLDFLEANKSRCCGFFINHRYQEEINVISELKDKLEKPRLDKDLIFYITEARTALNVDANTPSYTADLLRQLLVTEPQAVSENTPLLI